MANWVPFHEELRQVAKRGISRAVRFIFLELAMECRKGRGSIRLPVGMNDVDAVHDLLGGRRSEIEEALQVLTTALPGEDGGGPMVVLEGPERARTLRIPCWVKWNHNKEAPGASTIRVRHHRAKKSRVPGSTFTNVFHRDGGACRYYGSSTRLSLDHIIPLVSGGPDDEENLVLACVPCNSRKGGRTPEQARMRLRPAPGGVR